MTEMTSVGTDLKVCKVCDPNHPTGCQLADGFCAYRDLDTLDHSIGKSLTSPTK